MIYQLLGNIDPKNIDVQEAINDLCVQQLSQNVKKIKVIELKKMHFFVLLLFLE